MESQIYDTDGVNLKSMITCIQEIKKIEEKNQQLYVEVIRNLSEYLIYGERHDLAYFDIFCEKNTLEAFSRTLQMNNRFLNMQLI